MPDPVPNVLLQRRLGRYEILERLGAGGMGEVWLALRHGTRGFVRAVALKRILPEFARHPAFVDSLRREAAVAAMLHHPNCVQVDELEELDGEVVLGMEMLYGAPLDVLANVCIERKRAFPVGAAVRIAADAARALEYVHQLDDGEGQVLGVVHRDVSPQNLFVTESGSTKVVDFGIAKAVDVLDSDTRTGALKGKLRYMSPEQADFGVVAAKTDVWSLGVTLWELLAGEPPFQGGGVLALLEKIKTAELPSLREKRPDAPEGIFDVLEAAMQRDAEARASAAEVATQLEHLAATLPDASHADVAAFLKREVGTNVQELKRKTAQAARFAQRLGTSGEIAVAELTPSKRFEELAKETTPGIHARVPRAERAPTRDVRPTGPVDTSAESPITATAPRDGAIDRFGFAPTQPMSPAFDALAAKRAPESTPSPTPSALAAPRPRPASQTPSPFASTIAAPTQAHPRASLPRVFSVQASDVAGFALGATLAAVIYFLTQR